MLFFMNFMME